MTTDIIEINNFIVLIEQSAAEKTVVSRCDVDDQVIGISFYGSGEVDIDIRFGKNKKTYHNTTGIVTSFFVNDKVDFLHRISPEKPLRSISIFSTLKNLNKLPTQELEIFSQHLAPLLHAKEDFVEGPSFHMTADMLTAVDKILNTSYKGVSRMMFLRSQVIELLAHFFASLSNAEKTTINSSDREKLFQAKEILNQNIDAPPTLNELSKLIGLNNYKLKKNFKELFGVPVFKYLQQERLNKAHEILQTKNMSIQEAAWFVGYESLSSFSNAFHKKFGYRPSQLKK